MVERRAPAKYDLVVESDAYECVGSNQLGLTVVDVRYNGEDCSERAVCFLRVVTWVGCLYVRMYSANQSKGHFG